jgi:hypothetical protein
LLEAGGWGGYKRERGGKGIACPLLSRPS